MIAEPWERVTSRSPYPHTVYWRRNHGTNLRLTVGREYAPDGEPLKAWHWNVWKRDDPPRSGPLVTGPCSGVANGRRLADAWLAERLAQEYEAAR